MFRELGRPRNSFQGLARGRQGSEPDKADTSGNTTLGDVIGGFINWIVKVGARLFGQLMRLVIMRRRYSMGLFC